MNEMAYMKEIFRFGRELEKNYTSDYCSGVWKEKRTLVVQVKHQKTHHEFMLNGKKAKGTALKRELEWLQMLEKKRENKLIK